MTLAACSSADSGAGAPDEQDVTSASRLDVNDVSILFPLPKSQADTAKLLGLDAEGPNGPLLSKDAFATLLSFAHPEDDPTFARNHLDDPARWRIVAVRVEPCAKADPKDSACTTQIRLVAQPLTAGSGVTAEDDAMHLIYDFGPGPVLPIVKELVDLKKSSSVATNGKALGVHPAMAKEGLDGKFATAVKDFVTRHAGASKMPFATVMLTLNAGTWRFARGDFANGSFTQGAIPFVDGKVINFVGTTGTIGNFIDSVDPPATGPDNVNAIVDSNGKGEAPFKQGSFFKLPADEQSRDVDAALRIDNPEIHTPATVDCVSCHQATRSLARVKGVDFLGAKDDNPNRFEAAAGITTKLASDPEDVSSAYSVRAFGYQGKAIAMTQGAVNSSAHVADDINTNILAKKLIQP